MKRVAGLGVAVLVAACAAGRAAAQVEAVATTAASRPALLTEDPTKPSAGRANAAGAVSAGWMKKHQALLATAKAAAGGMAPIDLYMLGDSITEKWKGVFPESWNRNLGAMKPGDFGISGDRTQNVLYRLANGELDGVNPKVVVLLIGTNNLAFNKTYGANSVEDTVRGIKAVIDAVQTKAPQAKILLMAIFPRNDTGKTPPEIWTNICQTNEAIAKFADGKTVRFLNINDELGDKEGKLFPGMMGADRVHPAEKGYQVWADAMRPVLEGWLGKSPSVPANGN